MADKERHVYIIIQTKKDRYILVQTKIEEMEVLSKQIYAVVYGTLKISFTSQTADNSHSTSAGLKGKKRDCSQ